MKILKKSLILILAAFTALTCACTGNTVSYTIFGGSFWLSATETGGVAKVNETCTYKVSFTPEKDSNTDLVYDDESKLVTTLSTKTANDVLYYSFTTELTVTGTYKLGEKTYPINDKITSECLFLGINDQLKPLKSSKKVSSATFNSDKSMSFISYAQEIEYSGRNAKVTVSEFEKISDELKELGVTQTEIPSYEKDFENLKTPLIDNEITLFFPRAAELTSGFGATYYSIDALASKVHTMRLSVNSEKSVSEIEAADFVQDGTHYAEKKFACNNAVISLSESFSGSSLRLFFAAAGNKNDNKRRLISMETDAPYRMGTVSYTITSVSTAE